MAKKAAYTGTQKKALKQAAHGARKGSQSLEEYLRYGKNYKHVSQSMKDTLKGEEKYFGTSKDPYKDIKQFLPGGKAYKKPDYHKEGLQGYEMAQKVLAPIEQESIRRYQQETIPETYGRFGREQGAGSSALNQALAAARTNLESQLHAQTAELSARYGSDISKMNLSENARQQQMQFGTAADIFNAQREAELGHGSRQRDIQSYLAGLGTQAAGGLAGAPIQSPYLQQGAGSPSIMSRIGGSLLQGAIGGIGGFLAGGPPGAAAGAVGGGVKGFLG